MADAEVNLNKLYARDHDAMVTARGLLVGPNKALTKLLQATEALEAQAAEARSKLQDDARALSDASSQSIAQLTAQREMLMSTLLAEITHIEHDTTFSIHTLVEANQHGQRQYARLDENKRDEVSSLHAELQQQRDKYAKYEATAEKVQRDFAAEVARLCGVVEELKADMKRQNEEARDAYALLSRNMSNALADKQRTIDARDAKVAELEATLGDTSSTLNGKLRDLAREKAEREQRLEQEKSDLAERGRRAAMELEQRLSMTRVEKEQQERRLADELQRTQSESQKQAESLKNKIEKMRKLQELALGGVAGGEDGTPRQTSRAPSTRGRQLLYYESLKNKGREQSSMSWRGNDVWAHEQVGKYNESLRQSHAALSESPH